MKEIQLTRGHIALVDDADYGALAGFKWQAYKHKSTWYARRGVWEGTNNRSVLMHRQVMEAGNGIGVDHRDGNGLNNQRSNLRLATQQQNTYNRGKSRNNTSGYKGVSWDASRGLWFAAIGVNGSLKHLGRFKDKMDAAEAYAQAAQKYHGEFAHL